MSYQPLRGGFDLRWGTVVGAGTYFLGVLLTAVVWHTGLHPDRGIWQSGPGGIEDYFIYHGFIHLPGWGGALRGEVILYTVVWIYLLVGAGFVAARRRSAGGSFTAGASVTAGYLAAAVAVTLLLTQVLSAISVPLSVLFRPMLIVGVVYPVVFGGVGGALAGIV